MAKPKRAIRMESDPQEEKIVETVIDFVWSVSARQQNLFSETRAERLSAIPVAPPVGYQKQPSMVDHIRGLVRSEHLRYAATNSGYETFEESEDFETGDEYDPTSPYEADFEPLNPAPPSDAAPLKPGNPAEPGGTQAPTPPADPPQPPPAASKTA